MGTWLVCGGRDFNNVRYMNLYLDRLAMDRGWPSTVIHGGATGADTGAELWARGVGCEIRRFDADWNMHGRAAGPIRNQSMLDEGKPDLVIAFPGGRGTADMVRRARQVGIEVIEGFA